MSSAQATPGDVPQEGISSGALAAPGEVRIVPSGAAVGAEILGLDLTDPPTPEAVELIERAVADHGVVLLRGLDLDEAAQMRLTDALEAPAVREGEAELGLQSLHVGHDPEWDLDRVQVGDELEAWHADGQALPEPMVYTVLYAIAVPERGGETQFASLTRAYRELDRWTRLRLGLLHGEHIAQGYGMVTHPAVMRHPRSGEPCLFVSPGYTRRLRGPGSRRRALLRRLFGHITQERFVWTHHWRPGDLLVFDNFTTIHRRLRFDPDARRVLRLTRRFPRSSPAASYSAGDGGTSEDRHDRGGMQMTETSEAVGSAGGAPVVGAPVLDLARRDGALVLLALSAWAAAETFHAVTGLGLAALLAMVNGVVAGIFVTRRAHEWGHFAGARWGGGIATTRPLTTLFPIFELDYVRSSDVAFRAMSVGGNLGHWAFVLALLIGLPLATPGCIALFCAAFGYAVYGSVTELPVIRRAFAGASAMESFKGLTGDVLRRNKWIGACAGAALFLALVS